MTQKYYQIFKKEQGFTLTLTSFNKTLLLRNERRIKDRIIQSFLETQNVVTHSFSNLKAKQLEQIVNYHQQQQIQKHQQQQSQQNTTIFAAIWKNQSSSQQKQQSLGNQKKFFLFKMNLRHYMVHIYLKISMKELYLNYLGYAQQTISVTTLISKDHFLEILGKKSLCLCKGA